VSVQPRYPIYIPTRGRWQRERALTVQCLLRDGVEFHVVVEPPEVEAYTHAVGADRVLELPFTGLGLGSIPARNWIKDHATAAGHARHWQLDDNMREFRRLWRGNRIPCEAGVALRVCEDFTDRYENIGVSGLNYMMFVLDSTPTPFYLNVHVYSCTLVNNAIPYRWRGRYNEDTDLCLQALSGGWCTVLINTFMAAKIQTMTTPGGNSDELYTGDGRLRMARALQQAWPHVVTVSRRYGRPQHVVNWQAFNTPLQLKPGVDLAALPPVDEYGLNLNEVKAIKSPALQQWVHDNPLPD
jgi:hypothetical protein